MAVPVSLWHFGLPGPQMEATKYIMNLSLQSIKDSTFWRLVNRLWPFLDADMAIEAWPRWL